jgi:hypothetical protein
MKRQKLELSLTSLENFLLHEPKVKLPEAEKTWHRFSFGTERLRRFPKKFSGHSGKTLHLGVIEPGC